MKAKLETALRQIIARSKEERAMDLMEKMKEIIERDPDSSEGKNAAKRLEELREKYIWSHDDDIKQTPREEQEEREYKEHQNQKTRDANRIEIHTQEQEELIEYLKNRGVKHLSFDMITPKKQGTIKWEDHEGNEWYIDFSNTDKFDYRYVVPQKEVDFDDFDDLMDELEKADWSK